MYDLVDVNLELDPIKVYKELHANGDVDGPAEGMTDPQEALALPAVQAEVEERAGIMRDLVECFLGAIISHIDEVPFGLRWLCKAIRTKCLKHFPEASLEAVGSLVGGFFLLRYINPAIISPEAYGILLKKPSAAVRRSLTQIAKILQTIANGASTPRGNLGNVLSGFLGKQRQHLGKFLLNLCDVGDFHEEQRLEQLFSMASISSTIQITPNEVCAVHNLLCKYGGKMELPKEDELSIIMGELGEPPSGKLSREQNTIMELRLCSRWGPRHQPEERSSLGSLDDEPGARCRVGICGQRTWKGGRGRCQREWRKDQVKRGESLRCALVLRRAPSPCNRSLALPCRNHACHLASRGERARPDQGCV